MGGIQIIHFTQDQARTITGISSETLRHWRKSIPYLAEKSGKAARFSFSDLLCLAAIAQAIETFGVSISNIGPTMDFLFRKIAEIRPSQLQKHAIVVSKNEAIICRVDEIAQIEFSVPVMIIPLSQTMETMRQCLLPDASSEIQMQIPFSPYSVSS